MGVALVYICTDRGHPNRIRTMLVEHWSSCLSHCLTCRPLIDILYASSIAKDNYELSQPKIDPNRYETYSHWAAAGI